MLFKWRLKCSFCGKSAAQVAELVAGHRGYICDACAAAAHRIMSEGEPTSAPPTVPHFPSLGARMKRLFGPLPRVGTSALLLHRSA